MTTFSFRIPASTSNLGAGFDALGLAFNRYLTIYLEPDSRFRISATGTNVDSIPLTSENLIKCVADSVSAKRKRPLPPFHMRIDNEIPLARGLGSSAAAIIAGITCYELMTGEQLSDGDVFRYAYEFESHPDNLAAAFYGGLIAGATSAEGETSVVQLDVPVGAAPVVVIPEFELSTGKARAVLPASYSRADAVYNIQRSALTIAALTTGNWSLLREAMRDRIHQPYRAKLIPGLDEILELEMPGLFAVALSGAGPTVFALAETSQTVPVGEAIARIFAKYGVRATPHTLEIDKKGRVVD